MTKSHWLDPQAKGPAHNCSFKPSIGAPPRVTTIDLACRYSCSDGSNGPIVAWSEMTNQG